MRRGHSHEDVDQVFGGAADWICRRLPRAETSDDVVASLNNSLQQLERLREPQRRCIKLDATRDWRLSMIFLDFKDFRCIFLHDNVSK